MTKPVKILLVDDEPNILIPIEFLMQQQGFQVAKAYNGREALDQVESFHPEIVVLDVMMPGMDGFEVARIIRNTPGCDDVRIVFLTARDTEADRINGYARGGEIYLTKPFDNDELVQLILEVAQFG